MPARAVVVPAVSIAAVTLIAGCGGGSARGAETHAGPAPVLPAGTTGTSGATADTVPLVPIRRAAGPFDCSTTVTQTLDGVAQRVLEQTAAGRNLQDAEKRLSAPGALGDAVEQGDTAAATAALRPLLKHQIARLEVTHGAATVLRYGTVPALGSGTGVLRDTAGRVAGSFTVSTAKADGIDGLLSSLTGDEVALQRGRHTLDTTLPAAPVGLGGLTRWTAPGGTSYRVIRLAAQAFPSLPIQVALLRPAGIKPTCAKTRERTVADTERTVAEQLFSSEARGRHAQRVLQHVGSDPRFAAAVREDDAAGLRTAIVRFFRDRRLHVVRIRATDRAGRLVNDVGGPDVIAPISGPVRGRGGRVVGRVTLSIQDDTGYVKLLERFTGAAVQLATPAGAVPGGTLPSVPADLPAQGTVEVAGRTYVATGFTARAYPSGPLSVRLLLPTR